MYKYTITGVFISFNHQTFFAEYGRNHQILHANRSIWGPIYKKS